MLVKMKSFALLVIYFAFSYGKSLPSYLKACSAKDPNLDKCTTEQAQTALQHIKGGDKEYNIPNLVPFHVDHADISPGPGLSLIVRNAKGYGLDEIIFDSVKLDLDKKLLKLDMSGRIEINADYDVKGQILILAVEGKGICNVTAEGHFHQVLPYELVDKNGKPHMKLLDTDTFEEELKNVYFNFDINDDEVLGKQLHTFLSENRDEIAKEVGPTIFGAIASISKQLASNILTKVPFNELILDA